MGELRDGDQVLDSNGLPCSVVKAHPIEQNPVSFRLTFDDGQEILACADHLWHTYTASELMAVVNRTEEYKAKRRGERGSRATGSRGQKVTELITARNKAIKKECLGQPTGEVRTTRQIFNTLHTIRGQSNHYIQNCKPLDLPEKEFALAPYLLGIWLGDETATDSRITTIDQQILIEFKSHGFRVEKWNDSFGYGVYGLLPILIDLGVFDNKHIPNDYLRGSYRQRLDILQGLMDMSGHVSITGSSEFVSGNKRLADGVAELVHSMGAKAKIYKWNDPFTTQTKYRVKWSSSIPSFRLGRKLAKQKPNNRRNTRMRAIVKCEPILPVPMRCITVDSPDHLYLAGRGMIPTHNTYALLMEPSRHVHNKDFTFTIFRRSIPQIDNQGALWDESYKIYPILGGVPIDGNHIWRFPSGAEGKFAHLQEEKTIYDYDGSQIPLIEFDQLEQFTEKQFFYMMSRNRSGCGVRPYIRASANPPPNRGHWLRALVDWWIGKDGFPIKERSGVLRYFTRDGNSIEYAGPSRQAAIERRQLERHRRGRDVPKG
jgi:hypothetical protein